MQKKYALIVGLALSLTGCATWSAHVKIPNSNLSFRIPKEVTPSAYFVIENCFYYLDDYKIGPTMSCPPVMRLQHMNHDGVINVMAFPVQLETFLNDVALRQTLEEYFDRDFQGFDEPNIEASVITPDRSEANLTWRLKSGAITKERIVVFQVNAKKETVFMVGQWPANVHQEMVAVQNQIAADILSKSKQEPM